ncbi:MAG: penicillin-binding protein 2 [Eubacteriales bacterium]
MKEGRKKKKSGLFIRKKKIFILFFCIAAAFVGLSARLIIINREDGEEYKKQVLSQQQEQYESTTIPYKRGDILDTNGNILATTEKVYNLIVDSKMILTKEEYLEPTMAALSSCFPEVDIQTIRNYIEDNPTSQYYVVSKRMTYDEISGFLILQEELIEAGDPEVEAGLSIGSKKNANVQGIWFEEEYKRVYPNNTLASNAVGFSGTDNNGLSGLEGYYNDTLNGTDGRSYGYLNDDGTLEGTTISATDGYNIVSTIDVNIQSIVEKYILEYNEEYTNNARTGNGAQNIGCIIMDVNSGEILAMANYPNYNLNDTYNTSALIGSQLLNVDGSVDELGTVITADNVDEVLADTDVMYQNLNNLWNNFCISSTFEPGSTAKPFVVAAGLDSGKMTGDEYYTCNGALEVADYIIKCHAYLSGGEGTLSVQEAIEQSCNVALMLMGNQIGRSVFLEYQQKFNFGLKTNIDLSGETRTDSLVFNENTMGVTELATSSFGQGYNVTMIQMIAAFSSLVNGGYYYEPHMVSQITTADGAVVENIEPRILKQTVSESVSDTIQEYLLGVVENGTGTTAKPAGYSIGGKTGTAEMVPRDKINYVVSFMGCAPAIDPEIAIYVVVDRPNVVAQDDAKHATRLVRSILTEVLPYMKIFMTEELSEDEILELEELNLSLTTAPESDEPLLDENGEVIEPEEETTTPGDVLENGAVVQEDGSIDANGGDTSSSFGVTDEEIGDTAPLTGTVLNPSTGEAVQQEEGEGVF